MPGMTLAEATAKLVDIADGIASAQASIRAALMAGESTADSRRWLAKLEADQAECRRLRDHIMAAQEAEAAGRVSDAARRMAADVAARLRDRLDALEPPPAPASVGATP